VITFRDRQDAGRRLAEHLQHLAGEAMVVLGLPRGGVPVAFEVARALGAPLDVVLVRKLGVPVQPELAMGAIGEDGVRVISADVVRSFGVDEHELARVEARERGELERRVARYRRGRPMTSVSGITAIVVDDGIATGATARAACEVMREHGARRVVLAVPVAAPSSVARLEEVADEVVCVTTPPTLRSVGEWYDDFEQTTDEQVVDLLDASRSTAAPSRGAGDVELLIDDVHLPGRLVVPPSAGGLVLFAHGSGSSRLSPRNRTVAEVLERAGFGTLLFDLLTTSESSDRANVFDIQLLGSRLAGVTRLLRAQPSIGRLPLGYFGASTGGAAALWAAAEADLEIGAVVVRGGRPDLAGARVSAVQAPTLLIVGGDDVEVLELNRRAAARLRCEHRVDVIPGATHLFEEPGALDTVARLAATWFGTHLGVGGA
jgi:putative phosphoribosyl transferase